MSCHTCATSFGFLKKELGCPVCGFAFCGKCLKYEIKDKKSSLRVCRSCSQKSTTEGDRLKSGTAVTSTAMDFDPPDAYLRRIETLENPSRPPVTVYTQNPAPALRSFQVEPNPSVPSEQELRGRLQKLRQRLTTAPSVEEMEERLAKLQGMPMKSKSQSFDVASLPLSGEEQTRRLMQQIKEETSLPEQSSAGLQDEIEARLARLKGIESEAKADMVAPVPETMEPEPTDAEGLIRQISSKLGSVPQQADEESELEIVNKILAKVALDEKLGEDGDSDDDEPISETMEEELPWCCICNEDATLRCPGCAGDLYCGRCFKEGHDVCDMRDHKPTSFQPKCPT